ncbi:acrosomal protein SP-10-like [Psammomys obesus]|uniref:acrosomal protein SP-10-like n=1 Tax=Psammomys obesus TaxID=48139 RepID=UPI002452FD60|nr:acrosomal protein SP-10-like [Psammomys obesus]
MKELILLSLYVLGSARGVPPGQPDELLESPDKQASVQQLSSEYFSFANPSDVEALYETPSGEKSLNDHSSSEHESSEDATGEHSSEQSSGEHTSGEHTSNEQSSGDSNDVTSEAAASDISNEKAEEAGEASGEGSSAEKANDGMSTAFPSTSSGVVINCHTCAYMNDDGKCLRGEGICTTQNSQQCMLKKIFEGGKLQFMVQGCENMCPSMNLFSHGTRMQIMCCQNEPLCNKI